MAQDYDCIVIGAGMSGLAAAIRLAHYGRRVLVLERHAIAGGLNSHYSRDGRRFDVGLHAMTNFVPRGTRAAPLSKLLRQLRIDYGELDLVEQSFSAIDFPGARLRFGNAAAGLEEEIDRQFPGEIDGFRRLVATIRGMDDTALDRPYESARLRVAQFITSPLLAEMLFCPVMYYGSAVEDDMDFSQFSIMFKALFLEGFCRPQIGVRQILRVLLKRLREAGAELRLRCGVSSLLLREGRCYGVRLEDGREISAGLVLSSAGLWETADLMAAAAVKPAVDLPERCVGRLAYVESIHALDVMPATVGIDETIVFYSLDDKFAYRCPTEAVSLRSGVICLPSNFRYRDQPPAEGLVRFTSLANYAQWQSLAADAQLYAEAKCAFVQGQLDSTSIGRALAAHVTYTDAFTPLTVQRFTSHLGGAIYGSPHKVKDGRLGIDGLVLMGTDQGFLGIVGALLSGISMANLHGLKGEGA